MAHPGPSAASSSANLCELTTTKYVEWINDDVIETVRGVSCNRMPKNDDDEDKIEVLHYEDVVLEDDRADRPIHGVDDTPKLIVKKEPMRVRDEAVKMLKKLLSTPVEKLVCERHDYYKQRLFNTTRKSEFKLCEYVLLHPNARPGVFSCQVRCLDIEDIPKLILSSFMAAPKDKGQSLVTFAIKTRTDLNFEKLVEILDKFVDEQIGFTISDPIVDASLIEETRHRNVIHKLRTADYKQYAQLESKLDHSGQLITSKATLSCSVRGKRHIQTQISYFNNGCKRQDAIYRNRFIEIEQTVKCTNRRVIIAEDRNEMVEFEIEGEMIPLSHGIPTVNDLIDYLKSGKLENQMD